MRLKSSVRRKVENRIVTEYLGFKKYFFLKWAFILKENATFALQMLHVHQTTGMLALESEFTICDSYKRTLWSAA